MSSLTSCSGRYRAIPSVLICSLLHFPLSSARRFPNGSTRRAEGTPNSHILLGWNGLEPKWLSMLTHLRSSKCSMFVLNVNRPMFVLNVVRTSPYLHQLRSSSMLTPAELRILVLTRWWTSNFTQSNNDRAVTVQHTPTLYMKLHNTQQRQACRRFLLVARKGRMCASTCSHALLCANVRVSIGVHLFLALGWTLVCANIRHGANLLHLRLKRPPPSSMPRGRCPSAFCTRAGHHHGRCSSRARSVCECVKQTALPHSS